MARGSHINARAMRTRCSSPDESTPMGVALRCATERSSRHASAFWWSSAEYSFHHTSRAPNFAEMTTSCAVRAVRSSEASEADTYANRGRTGRMSNDPRRWPLIMMSPLLGWRYNDIVCNRVVFPHPFGPRMAQCSPWETDNETLSTVVLVSRRTDTFTTLMTGVLAGEVGIVTTVVGVAK